MNKYKVCLSIIEVWIIPFLHFLWKCLAHPLFHFEYLNYFSRNDELSLFLATNQI